MSLAFPLARRTSRAALLDTWLDGGTLALYDGTRPADADTALDTQTLLATFTGLAGGAATGAWTASPLPDDALVLATATVTWARLRDSSDATVADLDVGATGSGADVEVGATALVAGAYVALTSLVITEG